MHVVVVVVVVVVVAVVAVVAVIAFTLNVRGINSRQHTQSVNFTNRGETLLQSAPETEHYDDRPPTYP